TAGNASPLNDGATALVLMSDSKAKERGLKPLARLVSAAPAGVHPDYMGIGPVPSSLKALEKAGLQPSDMQVVELNEAFASQSLACVRLLGLDEDRVNVNGGVLSLGTDGGWRRRAARETGLRPGGSAVDVACGSGKLTAELAKIAGPAGRVVGVDFSPQMLEVARRAHPGLEFLEGDALNLQFD